MLNVSADRVTLKRRVLNAGKWSLVGYGLGQAVRFGTNLLMTRILVPEMFGVMGIASVLLVGLTLFSDLGIKPSIIQNQRGNDPAFLNTAWVVQILRGALLWLIALAIALLLFVADRFDAVPRESVYADARLPLVIAVMSFVAVIEGFASTKIFEENRKLSLARITFVGAASQIAALICMLCWALFDRSIWVLVSGGLCSALVRTALGHVLLPGTPNRWHWDKSAFSEIFQFGKWILAASVIGFLANNGDRLLLGGLVDSSTLGKYVIAFLIFDAVSQLLMRIIVDVSFPTLSEVARERPAHLKRSYYKFHVYIASFAWFTAGVFCVAGPRLIGLLYDARYHEAGWMLRILALALMTVPYSIAARCFVVLGKPSHLSYIGGIRLGTLAIATIVGFHLFGVLGSVWGIVLSYFSVVPVTIFFQVRHDIFDLRKELYALSAGFGGVALGFLSNYLIGKI